jgi:hypothetical protein
MAAFINEGARAVGYCRQPPPPPIKVYLASLSQELGSPLFIALKFINFE